MLGVLLVALVTACGSKAQDPPRNTLPPSEIEGDAGDHLYMQLSTAWCARRHDCAPVLDVGFPWVSELACAEDNVWAFALEPDGVSCRTSDGASAPAPTVSSCVNALLATDCETLVTGYRLAEQAFSGEFGTSCESLYNELVLDFLDTPNLRHAGEPCGYTEVCELGTFCDNDPFSGGCGRCRRLQEGDTCAVTDDGLPYCAAGYRCMIDTCTARVPGLGDACTDFNPCAKGLDCDDSHTCRVLFGSGSPCGEYNRCGNWLLCVDGTCMTEVEAGHLGAPCGSGGLSDCIGGICRDGACAELQDLDEPCETEMDCLSPYACVNGACTETLSCGAGQLGDVCTSSGQCGEGLGCFHGYPSTCQAYTGFLGAPCDETEPGSCNDGMCIDGICQLQSNGGPCEFARQCDSLFCSNGSCADPMCP